MAAEGIASGIVGELNGYDRSRREVSYGGGSRIDILLEDPAGRCYVEVKNVTMVDGRARYAFPDAVTDRGRKHLAELESMVRQGYRAVMLFLIQRSDGHGFTPAADIDPAYTKALHRAVDSGVEALAYRADVTPEAITIVERVEVGLGG